MLHLILLGVPGAKSPPQHLLKPPATRNTPLAGAHCALIAAIISNQHLQPLWTRGLKVTAMWFRSGLSEEGVRAALCLPPCAEALLETGAHPSPRVLALPGLRDALRMHLRTPKHRLILVLHQCLSLPGWFPLDSAAYYSSGAVFAGVSLTRHI